jgi:hypothetical protein
VDILKMKQWDDGKDARREELGKDEERKAPGGESWKECRRGRKR